MEKQKFKLTQKLRPYNCLKIQYFVLLFFWIIFISLLITALILFLEERTKIDKENNVNDILNQIANTTDNSIKTALYQKLMAISYPCNWFFINVI